MEMTVTGTHSVEGDNPTGGNRDLEIRLEREGYEDVLVERMFDANGSETHDPIAAVEIDDGSILLDRIRSGDVITVRVVINT